MNRRDPNAGSRQTGGYRSDENAWDSPRQANQWQADSNRQAGGGWDAGDDQRGSYLTDDARARRSASRDLEGRYTGDIRDEARSRYGDESRSDHRHGSNRPGYGARGGYGERGYQFSGHRDAGYPARDFDASAGNDFSSFTSEDYGGRDFSGSRGGLSGGMRSSDTYRPSYGPGSWGSSSRDYGDWREYGESRGFLERAGDEIASWFGNEDAQRRREQDHRGRGPSDYTRSDERIREDVNDTLTHDWRVDASNVRVTVKDGEVTLEGTVDSRQSKRRAEDMTDGVSGVRHVQNNLRVQTEGLTAGTGTPGYSHTTTTGTGSGTATTTTGMTGSGGTGSS